jgi:Copper type II ascorbate-dependent monooxygenase, C-terminal domain
MRTGLFACLVLVACGGGGGTSDNMTGDDTPGDDGGITPPARGFQIVSPDITIAAGEEVTYCYYFRTPNTEPMAINKWESAMTPGSHHLIVFTTGTTDKKPVGTIDRDNCGFGGVTNVPSWTYSAQTATASMVLPSDDGTGKPLAMDIPANTAGFVQMHYFNATDKAIQAHVTINAEALAAGAAFTKTAAYVTYDSDININAGATNHVEAQTCGGPPSGSKFWLMSTHAHKQAIKTEVIDAGNSAMIMSSTDWEHPAPEYFDGKQKPFYALSSENKITYRCTYNNPNVYKLTAGDSAATNEMCMASGYYFPATKPLICVNTANGSLGPF